MFWGGSSCERTPEAFSDVDLFVVTEDYVPLTDMKLVIELDVFAPPFAPLIMAEVEFPDIDTANAFLAPEWFDQDVTSDPAYHNSNMSSRVFE